MLSSPAFFWLIAFVFDCALFGLMSWKRQGRALCYLFGYKLVFHVLLFAVSLNPKAYVVTYGVYIGGLAILICWALCSLAYFDASGVYYCLLLSVLGSVLSIYCSPPGAFVTLVLQAYDRLCWLAPASMLLWGLYDRPPQFSRRSTFLYLGFVILICGQLVTSFSMLAGLHRITASVLYPLSCITWMIGLMQPEPELSIREAKKTLRSIARNCDSLKKTTTLSVLHTGNAAAYSVANGKRKVG